MAATATGVTVFHRAPDPAAFLAWASGIRDAAEGFAGFVDAQVVAPQEHELDWAAAVMFEHEEQLHAWLDSAQRAELFEMGESHGFRRASSDLILLPGCLPPGIAVFGHTVAPARDRHFEEAQARLTARIASFPGFEGSAVLGPRDNGRWFAVLRFRTEHQLDAWMRSRERMDALPELRSELAEDFTVTRSTAFGSIVRLQDGKARVTPSWKTAMLILLVLYPTVMTISRFLGPVLVEHGTPIWLSTWLSQIVSVGLLTWLLMPAVTTRFRRWLDPVDGSTTRVTIVGAAVVVASYAATLALFGSVRWLQFYDYPR